MEYSLTIIGILLFLLWLYSAWLIFGYWRALFRALAHTLPGRKMAYLFRVSMWNFQGAEKYLKPSGLDVHQKVRQRGLLAAKFVLLWVFAIFLLVGSFLLADYMGWPGFSS